MLSVICGLTLMSNSSPLAAQTTPSVTRSFGQATVEPDGMVMITAVDYGSVGEVAETLPGLHTFLNSGADRLVQNGQEVRFALQGANESFSYVAMASGTEGIHSFSGTLRDVDRNDHPVGGASDVTVSNVQVSAQGSLFERYDVNGNMEIDKEEALTAIEDYLFHGIITKDEMLDIVDFYLFGTTPALTCSDLHKAVEESDLEAVTTLVGLCPEHLNVERRYATNLYETPLTLAVKANVADIVRILVDAGADPNQDMEQSASDPGIFYRSSSRHETALSIAVRANTAEIVQILIDAGGDPNKKLYRKTSGTIFIGGTTYYETPLEIAIAAGHTTVIEILKGLSRAALIALYNATDGPNWSVNTNWLTDQPFGMWHGVTTDDSGHVIIGLDLDGNRLSGELPPELGRLTGLMRLHLDNNRLSGETPSEFGKLSQLKELYLSGNQLSGCVPSEIRHTTRNDFENLGLPFCAPTLPPESDETDWKALVALYNSTDGENWSTQRYWLGNRPLEWWYGVTTDGNGKVTSVDLSYKQLSGEIPPELGNLSSLKDLDLSSNDLSGEIPPEFGNLSNLEELELDDNQLSGKIPAELSRLTGLTRLYLGYNQLSGEIPSELGNLSNLDWLSLSGNDLSGEMPSELGNLANLRGLSLSGNDLSGEMPSELGNLAKLGGLYLSGNDLSGEIPSELGRLSNLDDLELDDNQLSGKIPAELGNLANLWRLYLSGNDLSGEIPSGLGNLSRLKYLRLNHNDLSGEIPSELGNLSQLEDLHLNDNQLRGKIPSELGNLSQLDDLYLRNNQLSGCIPVNLRYVDDHDLNQLSLPYCE